MNDPTLNDLRVLTTTEASELLTVSMPVLERWRREGRGPTYLQLSERRVGYRLADLRTWMEQQAKSGQKRAA